MERVPEPMDGDDRTTVANTRAGERHLTEAARAVFQRWDMRTEPVREMLPERVAMATGSGSSHLYRLSLLLSLIDGGDAIDAEHITAAGAVVDYATATASRLYGPGSMGTDSRILTECKKAGGSLTRTDLRDALGRNVPSADITAALDELVTAAFVTVDEKHQDVGRPVKPSP